MIILNDSIIFFKANFHNIKELNYMLQHLFNDITDSKEIEEIKSNITKINNGSKKK